MGIHKIIGRVHNQNNTVLGKRNGPAKKIALKENVDYVITYSNNVNAGEASY